MIDWRSRGYVQDSEDDDERSEESQDLQNEDEPLARLRDTADLGPTTGPQSGNHEQDVRDDRRDSPEGLDREWSCAERTEEKSAAVGDGELSEDELAIGWPTRKSETQQSSSKVSLPHLDRVVDDDVCAMSQSSALSSPLPELAEFIGDVQHDHYARGDARTSPRIFLSSPPLPHEDLTTAAIAEEGLAEERAATNELADVRTRDQWAAPQRNFRKRKPIQLNPYQIMDGQYMQKMKSHGVRPTRVVLPPTADRQHNDQDSDSQSAGGNNTQSVYDSSPRPTHRPRTLSAASPASTRVQRVERQARSSSPPGMTLDDDDLPSLNVLLNQRAGKAKVYHGSKRRKLTHQLQLQPEGVQSFNVRRARGGAEFDNDFQLIRTPISPGTSPRVPQDLPRICGRDGFRFPPAAFSPQKPPTPATSSSANGALRRRHRIGSDVHSSPAPVDLTTVCHTEKEPTVTSDEDDASDSGSQSSSSEQEESKKDSGHLKVIQRRMKGVLPASWLKLDVKAQGKLPSARMDSGKPEEPALKLRQPGVARRTFKPPGSARASLNTFAIPSDEDSNIEVSRPATSRSVSQNQQTRPARDEQVPSLYLEVDPGGTMEDNTFDFMLPTASRNGRSKTSKSRKLQTRLFDASGHVTKRLRGRRDQRKLSKVTTTPVLKPKPLKLSILDAIPDPEDTTIAQLTPLPSFVKVARRQARRHPEQARRLPALHVRLQTRDDTYDVQSVLSDWHSGKISRKRPQVSKPVRNRSPLMPVDSDMRQPPLHFDLEVGKTTLDSSYGAVEELATKAARKLIVRSDVSKSGTRRLLKHIPHLQDGQLEADDATTCFPHERLQFHQILRNKDQAYSASRKTAAQPLPRTLDELEAQISRRRELDKISGQSNTTGRQRQPISESVAQRTRRRRKVYPQRVDVEMVAYRQPIEFAVPQREQSAYAKLAVDVEKSGDVLHGLNPCGVPYSHAFDILPLPVGTYFHGSTFVGSSALNDCLEIPLKRNMDHSVHGTHVVSMAGESYTWGPWSEELSTNVRQILSRVANEMTVRNVTLGCGSDQALQTLLNANARWLSFSDKIDRNLFAQTFFDELEGLQTKLDMQTRSPDVLDQGIRTTARLLTLTSQVLVVLNTAEVNTELRARGEKLARRQADTLLTSILENGLEKIRTFYDNIRQHAVREAGIKDEPYVESFVIFHHTLKKLSIPDLSVWQVLNDRLLSSVELTLHVGALEHWWQTVFSVLPLCEIGIDGVHHTGHRFQESFDNWLAVKSLVSRPLNLYMETTRWPSTTINEYVRVLLSRCHHLIQAWGWQKCETIISFIFDFFAQRQYMSLAKEDTFASSRFLDELALQPSLQVLGNENAFQLFLKLVAAGLLSLRKVYSEKNVRSIVWRWLPNHSRTYDKAKELRKEALDALRNQHDLLCTLYWASPPSVRPRVQLIQNLVDHTASHLEACRISVKAWANLAAFQLSTGEPVAAAEPFVMWLKELVEQNISQYKLARPELEAQYEVARSAGVATVSADKLDLMISRNQNGVIAVIIDVVVGLKMAFETSTNLQPVWPILRDSHVQDVTALFDAKDKQTNKLVVEILAMFTAFVNTIDRAMDLGSQDVLVPIASIQGEMGSVQSSSRTGENFQGGNEESQDYGDWPEEEEARVTIKQEALIFVLEQVAHLLSTVMGSETSPTDEVLIRTTEHWAYLSSVAVRHNVSSWDTFLSDYGKHSWHQLRDTPQRRKLGPHFLSHVLRQDRNAFSQHREVLFSGWLSSLVERDAQLKFQHSLTAELLNHHPDDPLLQNLPFSKANGARTYIISANELRERRLALLSSVLSNMRDEYHKCIQVTPFSVRSLRAEYSSILGQVMAHMRRNYEELGQGGDIAGAYVPFVQAMIECMTQYTSDICAVDKYFTDSSSFPLPVGDPTYLVGRLKSYDGRLHDAKVVKQLIMFMQNVSERAAVDDEQEYLVSQLSTAMDCWSQIVGHGKASLRDMLLEVIFPVYIEASMDHPAAWILCRPVMLVCHNVFDGVLFGFSATKPSVVRAVTGAMTSILVSLTIAVSPLEFAPDQIKQESVMSTLTRMLAIATTCIPTVDYLRRRCGVGSSAINAIHYLRDFSLFAARVVTDDLAAFPPTNAGGGQLLNTAKIDPERVKLKRFCAQQLQQDFRERWKVEFGRYSVRRGTEWRKLQHITTTVTNEKDRLIKSVLRFHEALDRAASL